MKKERKWKGGERKSTSIYINKVSRKFLKLQNSPCFWTLQSSPCMSPNMIHIKKCLFPYPKIHIEAS